MKVALINNFPPKTGIGRYIFSLFHELHQNESVDCSMVCTYPMDLTGIHGRRKVEFLNTYRSFSLNRVLTYFLHPFRLPKGYDIYHISNQSIGRFAKFIHPSVITVYDVIPLKRTSEDLPPQARFRNVVTKSLYNYFVKKSIRSARYADKIICPSSFAGIDTVRHLGVEEQKVRVIEEGMDHKLFKPRERYKVRKRLELGIKKKIVLHVGNESDPRKNVPILLHALHKLTKDLDNVILIRVGTRTNEVKTLIDKLGLKVLYYNNISDRKLAFLYNAADLFVLPSYDEGTAQTALEAMASGCPVIASNVTGVPDTVGDAAILLDPFDVDGFAYWMREALTNETLWENLVDKGLKRSMRFSWKICAQETVKVYEEVLRKYA